MHTSFLQRFTIFFSGSLLVSAINYAFYPLLGRMLTVVEFGELQVLLAFLMQAGLLFSAFSVIVSHVTADTEHGNLKKEDLGKLRLVAVYTLCALSLSFLTFLIVTQGAFFNVSLVAAVLLLSCIYVNLLSVFNVAQIQGNQNFNIVSRQGLLQSGSKLCLGILFVWLGWGVYGVIGALLITGVIGYVYTKKYITPFVSAPIKSIAQYVQSVRDVSPFLAYGALAFLTEGSIALLFTIDVIAVKALFDPLTAGMYAGVSSIAKIAYFMLAPMASVLLPAVSAEVADRKRIVMTACGVLVTMTFCGVGLAYVAYEFLTKLLFGAAYAPLSYLLPLLTLTMALLALLQSCASYALAVRERFLRIAMPLGALSTVVLCLVNQSMPASIILNCLIGITLSLGLLPNTVKATST
jgi:O-antigen/teichoic acid export membrane protein